MILNSGISKNKDYIQLIMLCNCSNKNNDICKKHPDGKLFIKTHKEYDHSDMNL